MRRGLAIQFGVSFGSASEASPPGDAGGQDDEVTTTDPPMTDRSVIPDVLRVTLKSRRC